MVAEAARNGRTKSADPKPRRTASTSRAVGEENAAKASKATKGVEESRRRLVEAARQIMTAHGMRALQIRDVVRLSGVSTGSLYYHFPQMDDLAAAVNSGTLDDLDKMVSAVAPPDGSVAPRDVLVGLAVAYHRFARENTNLWAALFERGMGKHARPTTPDDVAEHMRLMVPIVVALGRLFPDESLDACRIHAGMLLSAIHGIVIMSLEQRMLGVPEKQVDSEIAFLLGSFCSGADAMRAAGTSDPPPRRKRSKTSE